MENWIAVTVMPLAHLGRKTRSGIHYLAVLSAFAYLPIKRTLFPPYAGLASILKTTVMQIYFTGVQALPLFVFLSFLLGLSLSLAFGQAGSIQAMLCNILLKGVAPILVALIILGRTGSAITVELGNMTVLGEIRLLRRMGIDPFRHVIFPRLMGVTFATFFLTIFFVLTSATITAVFSNSPFHVFLQELLKSWTVVDVLILAEKGLLFGIIISMVACFQGLNLIPYTTEVPKATIRTVIHCILLCASIDFMFLYFHLVAIGVLTI
jgi:phospholipid/cholesterol/gamma-HCH transport system permease protein